MFMTVDKRIRICWYVLITYCCIYFVFLGIRPLFIPDESRYAEISREMLVSGDWVVPRLVGLRYFEKPIGGYWLNNISLLVFGETNFAIRFMSSLSALVTSALVYFITLYGLRRRDVAISSAVVYLSIFLVFLIATYSTLDSMLTLFTTFGFVSFYYALKSGNRLQLITRYFLFGVFCGAGFLVKGPIALAIPFVSIVPFMFFIRRGRELIFYGVYALIGAITVILPWGILIHIK